MQFRQKGLVEPGHTRRTADATRVVRSYSDLMASHDVAGSFSIERLSIGRHGPLCIIAEAGVNHDGDLKAALALIDAAHSAGADIVKFQCFSANALVSADAPTCAYQAQSASVSQRDMLRRLELSRADFTQLKVHADQIGIAFLATPFGLRELASLIELGVPAFKIASPDIVNLPLLDAAARSRLPLIVSTGAAELNEIDATVARIRRNDANYPLALLHCISAYPTALKDAHLSCIRTLSDRYQTPVGFSDHTMEVETGSLAVAAGAVILEKHLTLDRRRTGPDHFFSLEPADFARYVERARSAHAALGDGVITVTPQQREVRQLARGSIVATRLIPAGAKLAADMLAVQRPGTGLSPLEWDQIVGRLTQREIQPGEQLAHDALR